MEFDPVILARISEKAGVGEGQARATIALLEDQSTVPFIARYRKEVTGNLDEVAIRAIEELLEYYKELLARRETILKSIEEQGKLTEELKAQILNCYEKNELEDLYLPYKPKRKTKASVALEKGLEPLAQFIWAQQPGQQSLEELADTFINAEKGVASREEALEGALHIVAEWVSENLEVRRQLRDLMMQEGVVTAKVVKGKEGQKSKFEMYYDFKEPVSKIPSHRMLAIRRGVKEQMLSFNIELDSEKAIGIITRLVLKEVETPFAPHIMASIKDSYERLLNPSLQAEVRALLKEQSDTEAIKVFEANLANLLLSPPAGSIRVLGIDPGFRTGCKVAVVDETGKFLDHATIYPTEPKKNLAQAERMLCQLIAKYRVDAIDIGNGTASRETDAFVKDFLKKYISGEPFEFEKKPAQPAAPAVKAEAEPAAEPAVESAPAEPAAAAVEETAAEAAPGEAQTEAPVVEASALPEAEAAAAPEVPAGAVSKEPAVALEAAAPAAAADAVAQAPLPAGEPRHPVFSVTVNESGASVYSASDGARKEFPDLDITVRGAISIARRLQDPLAELVKIHPKSIGVGQYQHDVDQNRLHEGLKATVESCVNRVGVDLNTASTELLKYVSGLNQRAAKRIVEFRNQNGQFNSRQQLLDVPGFGAKTFEQAAGFLRIKGGVNPLDSTAVHPESYPVVERIAQALGLDTQALIGNGQALEKLDVSQFTDEKAGLYTIQDIKEELLKPGRDPRSQFVVPSFREDVKEVSDLVEGMELEGTVTNVTNFGAFVDVGVHQDGLVHVSELSNHYVQDPREAVHVGQIVKVKVIGVDQDMKRISLSIKALMPKIAKPKSKRAKKHSRRPAPPKAQAQAPAPVAGSPAAEPATEARTPAPARPPRREERPPRQQQARPRPQPQATPQAPAKGEDRGKQKREIKPLLKPGKPEQAGFPSDMSFEEKIRLLREKFGGIK